jgi:hypothetical protein
MNSLARWISIIAHPFVMIAVLVAVAGWRFAPGSQALQALLLVIVVTIVPLAILMVCQVRRGRWSNVDASHTSERPILFLVALTALAALLGWLLLSNPHSFLIRGVIVISLLLVVAALLTRWVKLSLHLAFAGLTVTSLSVIGSAIGLALIPAVPLLIWSRLALSRHRPLELVVGLLLGVLAGLALIYL